MTDAELTDTMVRGFEILCVHARTIAMEVGAIGPEAVAVTEELRTLGKIDRETAASILLAIRGKK